MRTNWDVMAVALLYDDRLRPLLAGLAYTLLCVLSRRVAHWLAQLLEPSSDPGVVRIRQWQGWSPLAQALRLGLAVAFPFLMLLGGIFSATDVGAQRVNWDSALPGVAAVAAGAAVWLALLWCAYWRTRPETANPLRPNPDSWASTLANALRHAADAATYRGALMPLLGSYWGVWLAIVWKLLASLAGGEPVSRLRTPRQREYVFLDWALDWVGAVLYALSGSLLAALFGRGACLIAVPGIARRACRRRRGNQLTASAKNQGQDHQAREHDRGQNGDSLQIT